MSPEAAANLDALMAHAGWVERLARTLVLDPNAADDVVQAVWLEALERPPREAGDARGWLATVARNAARKLVRGESRRRVREEIAAKTERIADTTRLVDRAVLHRDLVDRVIALDEPYREVVLLRFFEELTTTAIARRLGRPRNTVQTRLQRGLERLRVRLDREYGDRESWGLALLPLGLTKRAGKLAAVGAQGSFTTWLGGWIMTWKSIAAASAVVIVGLWAWQATRRPVEAPPETRAAAPVALEPADALPPPPEVALTPRTAVERESPAAAAESVPPVEHQPVRGRVVDVRGRPLSGRTVAWHPRGSVRLEGDTLREDLPAGARLVELTEELRARIREEPTVLDALLSEFRHPEAARELIVNGPPELTMALTDGQGRFELRVMDEAGDVALVENELVLLGAGLTTTPPGEEEHVLVATHAVDVAGVVVDTNGHPVNDADVSVGATIEGLPAFPFVVEGSGNFTSTSARTDEAGRFRLASFPWAPRCRVSATKRGYDSADALLPETSTASLTLVLEEKEDRRFVSGRVTHADGTPAADAWVVLGQDASGTDERGAFRIEISHLHEGAPLVATKRGHQPAVVEGFADELRAAEGSAEDLQLTLGGAPKRLSGLVLRPDGAPAIGLTVGLADPTYTSPTSSDRTVETTGVRTDREGRFELSELSDREYRVRVFDPRTLVMVDSEPVLPGADDLVIRMPADATIEVTGRVLAHDRQPLAGVEVGFGVTTFRSATLSQWREGRTVTTDANGRFALDGVPRRHAFLSVGGPLVERERFEIADLDVSRPVELVVRRLFRFQVELAADEPADEFGFVDESGDPVHGTALRPDVTVRIRRLEVAPHNSGITIEVTDESTHLVLYRDGEELRRIAVHGIAGEIVPLRP